MSAWNSISSTEHTLNILVRTRKKNWGGGGEGQNNEVSTRKKRGGGGSSPKSPLIPKNLLRQLGLLARPVQLAQLVIIVLPL